MILRCWRWIEVKQLVRMSKKLWSTDGTWLKPAHRKQHPLLSISAYCAYACVCVWVWERVCTQVHLLSHISLSVVKLCASFSLFFAYSMFFFVCVWLGGALVHLFVTMSLSFFECVFRPPPPLHRYYETDNYSFVRFLCTHLAKVTKITDQEKKRKELKSFPAGVNPVKD